ncbi:hypothetical protein EDD16DRAFT_1519872 [Pisolithus croceorrhizus]|nr:hypothetical protein EDD16DRAFT_1519872 [Pisolithus croceorrhizus]KAI6163302.1 hypothetical protein EDD17DRAFT_1507309 [Pisolithus thermaeus]
MAHLSAEPHTALQGAAVRTYASQLRLLAQYRSEKGNKSSNILRVNTVHDVNSTEALEFLATMRFVPSLILFVTPFIAAVVGATASPHGLGLDALAKRQGFWQCLEWYTRCALRVRLGSAVEMPSYHVTNEIGVEDGAVLEERCGPKETSLLRTTKHAVLSMAEFRTVSVVSRLPHRTSSPNYENPFGGSYDFRLITVSEVVIGAGILILRVRAPESHSIAEVFVSPGLLGYNVIRLQWYERFFLAVRKPAPSVMHFAFPASFITAVVGAAVNPNGEGFDGPLRREAVPRADTVVLKSRS